MVRRAFAKGGLKDYGKTTGSRRGAAPPRARVVAALERPPIAAGSVSGERGRQNRHQQLAEPQLDAVARRRGDPAPRIYDRRHTSASWSLAAGVDSFTLARRMGTSVKMIDETHGHLITGADIRERALLDAFDERAADTFGRAMDAEGEADAA